MTTGKERVFSGVQPSGAQVHLGNYLGAMKRFVELSGTYETVFCIVDLHALTTVSDPKKLREYTISLAAAYLAIGIDPARTVLFRQSDVREVCELTWYLTTQFPLGLLERAHALKDARAKGLSVNCGLMFYPVLMAADILLYRATKVPVGPDQKQHLEMARDVREKFCSVYGNVFPAPEPLIDDVAGVIPGMDGRKMSKSYDNYIGLFESPKAIKAKINRIVTDSKGVEDVKDPETCNVFNLYKFFSSKEEQGALAECYRGGGMGYGYAKQQLIEVVEREVSPLRARYEDLINRPAYLCEILEDGARRARSIAEKTINDVRLAVGVSATL